MSERSYQPVGYALYFDDLRQEINGKYSLMGMYDAVMILYDPVPTTFSSFGIFVHYQEPRDIAITRKGDIIFQVYFPWDEVDRPSITTPFPFEEIAKSAAPSREEEDLISLVAFHFPIIIKNFVVQKTGFIRVRALLDGEIIRISALEIVHQPRMDRALAQ